MVSVDGSLFIQIINFLFLLYALNLVLFKPIRKILIERNEKFVGLEKGVERLLLRTNEKEMAFQDGVKSARSQGLKEKEALVEQASQEEKEILDKITKNAQANLAEVRAQVADEAEKARAALEKEIDVFAKAIGEKILGRAC